MADKEAKPEFVVTDRRLFSTDGELRQDVVAEEERRAAHERETREQQQRVNDERAGQQESDAPPPATPVAATVEPELPAPSSAEQQASADAYSATTRQFDERLEKEMRKQGQAHRAKDFEMTFEKFVVSIYMTALMQLGLAAPQGEKPAVDIISARQTIDTLSIMQEKTKGNLTPAEQNMLQNLLYELRMAYLEVTNMLSRPPQASGVDSKLK